MPRLRMKPMVTAGLVLAAMTPAVAQDSNVHLEPVIDSTVRIRVDGSAASATGWVIEPVDPVNRAGAAVVVTSLNVIEGARQIIVREPTVDRNYEATVLARDPDRNLVFLEVKDLTAKAIPLASAAPSAGRQVFALGYNAQADNSEGGKLAADASVAAGALSRELRGQISTEARVSVNQIEHRAEMLPGFEGGPLVDQCAHLIGMNIKSGGTVVRRARLHISPEATVMDALKVDEVIKAANQYGVKYANATGCGGTPAPMATPTATATATASATPTPAVTSTGGPAALLKSGPFLVVLGLLGVLAAAFGIYTLTRRDGEPGDPTVEPLQGTRNAPSRTVEEERGTALITDTRPVAAPERVLRLNGRGPAGEPIDLSFSAADLMSKPVTLGVGANAESRIPDNRTDYRVSRLHARLAYDGKTFTIEDNKSLNGTFVGGRRLESHAPTSLVNGDTIGIADIELTVSID